MYVIKERFFSIGDDFDVLDEHGTKVLHVDGKVLSVRNRVVIEDPSGPYRCDLGRFRIEPDLLELEGRNPVFVRWSMSNPSRFQFCASQGDGVRLKSSLIADHLNVLEAFASDEDGARMSIASGSACKPNFVWNWSNQPPGATYSYEVRFRDRNQRTCVIDPWILNGR